MDKFMSPRLRFVETVEGAPAGGATPAPVAEAAAPVADSLEKLLQEYPDFSDEQKAEVAEVAAPELATITAERDSFRQELETLRADHQKLLELTRKSLSKGTTVLTNDGIQPKAVAGPAPTGYQAPHAGASRIPGMLSPEEITAALTS